MSDPWAPALQQSQFSHSLYPKSRHIRRKKKVVTPRQDQQILVLLSQQLFLALSASREVKFGRESRKKKGQVRRMLSNVMREWELEGWRGTAQPSAEAELTATWGTILKAI